MSLKQRWGQWEAEDLLCPHYIALQGCVVPHNNNLTLFKARMEHSPPLSSSTNPLCSGEAGKVLRCPFLLQHQYISAQNIEALQGLESGTEYLIKPIGDALRCFGDGYYRKSRLVFTLVLKMVIPTKCFILWLHQSIFLFKHCIVLIVHFQFQGCIFIWSSGVVSWKCRNPCQNQPTKNKAVIKINFHSGHISKNSVEPRTAWQHYNSLLKAL